VLPNQIVHVENTEQGAARSKRGLCFRITNLGVPELVRQRYTNPLVMWVYSPHLRIVIGLLWVISKGIRSSSALTLPWPVQWVPLLAKRREKKRACFAVLTAELNQILLRSVPWIWHSPKWNPALLLIHTSSHTPTAYISQCQGNRVQGFFLFFFLSIWV